MAHTEVDILLPELAEISSLGDDVADMKEMAISNYLDDSCYASLLLVPPFSIFSSHKAVSVFMSDVRFVLRDPDIRIPRYAPINL